MNIVIRRKEETSVTYEQIVDLIHESFLERLEQGLRFTCSFMGVEEYRRKTEDSVILVAVLQDTDELVGTSCITILQDKKGQTYGYYEYLAVKPDKKRLGIGKKIEEVSSALAQKGQCHYIITDTAVGAKSSIKWHKKQGYKVIGLKSFSRTNFYSLIFRKQLSKLGILGKVSLMIQCCYSFVKTYCLYTPEGKHRKLVEKFY